MIMANVDIVIKHNEQEETDHLVDITINDLDLFSEVEVNILIEKLKEYHQYGKDLLEKRNKETEKKIENRNINNVEK